MNKTKLAIYIGCWLATFGVMAWLCLSAPGCISPQNRSATTMPAEVVAPTNTTGGIATTVIAPSEGDNWDSRILAGGVAFCLVWATIAYPVQRRLRLGKERAKQLQEKG